MSKGLIVGAVLAAAFVAYGFTTATVVKEGCEAELTGEVAFDPAVAAQKLWESKADEYFAKNAIDFNALVAESNGDFKSVASKYGHWSNGDKGELSFIVKGTGEITEVNTKKKSGYLGIRVDGYDGGKEVRLQVGPVVKGSAVRDSFALISVGDFQNQIEWAGISKSFHDLIVKDVISKLDIAGAQGKKADFIGCMTVDATGKIMITPVSLKLE